jgi:hypothetical protein
MLKRIVVGSAIAATSWYAFRRVTGWWRTWGVDPAEAALPLPGDELVPGATGVDTRGITIDAPPERVWPWLVQMGYGRGGWYSWDRMDMDGSSADRILPEHQSLAVDDVVPVGPEGGFVVRHVEPDRSLVLFVSDEVLASQRPAAAAPAGDGGVPAGLAASGRFLETATPPSFAASWAFVLRPLPEGRTRLLERVRVEMGEGTAVTRALGPVFGFGVFVMTQRQMTGIRDRAERRTPEPMPYPATS